MRKRAGNTFLVYSAGMEPKDEVFPPVVEVMREIGIDISDHKPKGIGQFLGAVHFEKVIIVCGDAEKRCPAIFGSAQRLFWPFDNPASARGSETDVLEMCRKTRDQIDSRICEWLKEQGVPA